MEYPSEPMDPLPEVLPDVDLPCQCGRESCGGFNFRSLRLIGSLYRREGDDQRSGSPKEVPWNLVRAALAQPAEVKVYGTMPKFDDLPDSIPAGCRYEYRGKWFVLTSTARRRAAHYDGAWKAVESDECGSAGSAAYFHKVDWSSVPIQPAPARSGSVRTCPGEGGYACNCAVCTTPADMPASVATTDPYLAHRAKLERDFGVTDSDGTIFTKMKSADDWRGNFQREAVRAERKRVEVGHPVCWPAGAYEDAESCDP